MKVFLALALAALPAACAPNPAAPLTRPKTILLIRHAEKPTDDFDMHLSREGAKRAEALPSLFDNDRSDPFPVPDFLFAAAESKHSNRSAETIAPLARALKQTVNVEFSNDQYGKLARELFANPKYAGKTVLICWHHGTLPELAARLSATDVPDKWKDPVFDRVWMVTFDEMNRGKPLMKRPQALMPGDEKK